MSAARHAWLLLAPLPATPAVDHVERILVLTAASGMWWSAAAGVATLALLVPAMIAMRKPDAVTSQLGAGLALYGCATIGATFFASSMGARHFQVKASSRREARERTVRHAGPRRGQQVIPEGAVSVTQLWVEQQTGHAP